jgi:2-oxo-3-hexenedioate decarboxylase
MDIHAAQHALRDARSSHRLLTRFTESDPTLDEAWGYAVQAADLADRLASGERVTGWKLGLTSEAKQRSMGIEEPLVSFLTDAMARVTSGDLVQPRVEPEIAFVLGRDVEGRVRPSEAASYVGEVALALEIVDSRWLGYQFEIADLLADASSAAGYLLGPGHPWHPALASTIAVWEVEGREPQEISTESILGNPLRAIVRLSEFLAGRHIVAGVGTVVLAGAMTDAVAAPTRVRLSHPTLGDVTWPATDGGADGIPSHATT